MCFQDPSLSHTIIYIEVHRGDNWGDLMKKLYLSRHLNSLQAYVVI